MLTINYQEIKKGVLGILSDKFSKEFPEALIEIEKYKHQSTCGSCERALFAKLYSIPNYEERIKRIYGPNIQIEKNTPPNSPNMIIESRVYKIPLAEWETWFTQFTKLNYDMQIRHLTTFLDKDIVVCSVVVLTKAPATT